MIGSKTFEQLLIFINFFQLLRQVKVDVREFSEASEDTNKFKNRVTNALPCEKTKSSMSRAKHTSLLVCCIVLNNVIFPVNHNRIVLNKKPGISGSDYINASFVDVST